MDAAREDNRIVLLFNRAEAGLLRGVLRGVTRQYQLKPGEIDPKVAEVWYSRRGCEGAALSAGETQEWLEHLHAFKSARLDAMGRWLEQLAARQEEVWPLRLGLEEAEMFLTVINDHRLFAAARHDIGQAEMDLGFSGDIVRLTPAQQAALLEIHFLAWIIEEVLSLLPGGGAEEKTP